MLLRTVSYTYYKTGQASNITIKDEDPDPGPGGPDPAYDVYYDLALYYHSHGPLWRALWGSYELDQAGDPNDYETSWAREFFYDSPRQRYLAVDYDTVVDEEGSSDPNDWTRDEPALWTDYAGELPYRDRDFEDDAFTDVLLYLGTAAQQTAGTNETAFLHGDLIGSTNLTTDDSGGTAASAVSYTAFGEILDANGSPGGEPPTGFTRYQYAGRYAYESDLLALSGVNPNLPDITLQHVGHRWYQPDIGRFVQRDPIGIEGGLNVYGYVLNHPVEYVDPSGLVVGFFHKIAKALGWKTAARGLGVAGAIYGAAEAGKKWGDFCQWAGRTIDPNGKSTYDTLAYYCLYAYHYPKDKVWDKAKKWWKRNGGALGGGGIRISCFVAGTEVAALRGQAAIEKLSVGDQLRSGHAKGEGPTEGAVASVGSGWARELVHVRLDGETLKCTPEHPFWVVGRGWVKAGRLRASERLLSVSGEEILILKVQFEHLRKRIRVYNITVNGSHTYHVGKNRVLVHNKMM